MSIEIIKRDDGINSQNIQNNLIPSYEHIRLWEDYKKLKIKLENHYQTLKLLTIKVLRINTTKGYHVQNKKLKFICKKGQAIHQDTWFIRKLLLINLRSIEIIQRLVQENRELQDLIDKSQDFAIQEIKGNRSEFSYDNLNLEGRFGVLLKDNPISNGLGPLPYLTGGKQECIPQILKLDRSKPEQDNNIQFSLNMLTMVSESLKKFANSKDYSSMITHFEAASIIDDLEISFGNFECLVTDLSDAKNEITNPFAPPRIEILENGKIEEKFITTLPILQSYHGNLPIRRDSIPHDSLEISIQDDLCTPGGVIDIILPTTSKDVYSEAQFQDPSQKITPNFENKSAVIECQDKLESVIAEPQLRVELLPLLQNEKHQRKRIHKIADEILRSQMEFLQLYPTVECRFVNVNYLNDIDWSTSPKTDAKLYEIFDQEIPKKSYSKTRGKCIDHESEPEDQETQLMDIGIGENSILIFNQECQVDQIDYIEVVETMYCAAELSDNTQGPRITESNTNYKRKKSLSYQDHKKSLQNLQDIIQCCKKNSTRNPQRTQVLPTSDYLNYSSREKFSQKKSPPQVPRIPKKVSNKELNPRTEMFWQNIKSQRSRLKQKYPGIPDMSKVCQIILQDNHSAGMSFQFVRSHRPNTHNFAINPFRAYI
ncbi:hypothetical protein QAD02_018490 [Eretmocerus hayati]|uniref:Uncharacterized protein n=1 Tax=Eretmocerus hayati TaxID=131215 RepID=A0ACC2PI04_9HYME|nr:hypothetical protein QAD02_018490 [Eretmocerus hayati]